MKKHVISLLIFICGCLLYPNIVTLAWFTEYEYEYKIGWTLFYIFGIASLILVIVAWILLRKRKEKMAKTLSIIATANIIIANLLFFVIMGKPGLIRTILNA